MDRLGNVTFKAQQAGTGTSYTYDAASRLESASSAGAVTAYTYDNNGNLTIVGSSSSYTYDRENRLPVTMNGIDPTSYTYDGSTGLRRSKKVAQPSSVATTTYIWDGSDYLGEENS